MNKEMLTNKQNFRLAVKNYVIMIKDAKLKVKIFKFFILIFFIYGISNATNLIIKNVKINTDNYKIENLNIYHVGNQYSFSGTARDIASGVIVEFNSATSDIVGSSHPIAKAIIDDLAKKAVSEDSK